LLYDKNIITKLVGFCYLDLNDKISDLLRSAFGIASPHPQKAIAIPKKLLLPKTIALIITKNGRHLHSYPKQWQF